MHKYKYFLIFFCSIIIFALCFWFPINFDNNDDQAMYFINSGVLSGLPSPHIVHTNLIIGFFVSKLFFFFNQINWYTLYLQLVQIAAFLTIYLIMIHNGRMNLLLSSLLLVFLLFGFSALCIVKLQFTVVALLCCTTALLCIQSEFSPKVRYALTLLFIVFAILIRKDSFFIFIAFNIPILLFQIINKNNIKAHVFLLIVSIGLFFSLNFLNKSAEVYKSNQTYKYFQVLDDIIDKPIKYTVADLNTFQFTIDDMIMMKARFPASASYSSGKNIMLFSEKIKSYRSVEELKTQLIKFIYDERYMILVYFLSITTILFFAPKSILPAIFNALIFLVLLLYLAITIRIPHRVTFPILFYLSAMNLYLLLKENRKYNISLILLFLFSLLGCYKFYCTSKLIYLHTQYHSVFKSYQNEINTHPNYLFISLHDGFPIEYMNAWLPPDELIKHNNLIMTGWNVWAPDFEITLRNHQLKNITSDLKNKHNVLFLTDSEEYQNAFINVMKQRYNLVCHFEKAENGFKVLHPKRLIFDN